MVLCYPSTPKKLAMTVACFVAGVSLFAVGSHYSYLNIAPQQARIRARNEFVRERLKQKRGKALILGSVILALVNQVFSVPVDHIIHKKMGSLGDFVS